MIIIYLSSSYHMFIICLSSNYHISIIYPSYVNHMFIMSKQAPMTPAQRYVNHMCINCLSYVYHTIIETKANAVRYVYHLLITKDKHMIKIWVKLSIITTCKSFAEIKSNSDTIKQAPYMLIICLSFVYHRLKPMTAICLSFVYHMLIAKNTIVYHNCLSYVYH